MTTSIRLVREQLPTRATMHATRTVTAVVALLAVSVIAAGAVSAARADDDEFRMGVLVGTWDVTVQLPGAPPGRVLATYNEDGTTVESAAADPATREHHTESGSGSGAISSRSRESS